MDVVELTVLLSTGYMYDIVRGSILKCGIYDCNCGVVVNVLACMSYIALRVVSLISKKDNSLCEPQITVLSLGFSCYSRLYVYRVAFIPSTRLVLIKNREDVFIKKLLWFCICFALVSWLRPLIFDKN